MGVKEMCVWMLLLLSALVLAESRGNAETDLHKDQDFIGVQSIPGRVSPGGPASYTPSPLQRPLEEMPPADDTLHDPDTLQEVLLAFQHVWNKDSGLAKQGFSQFGFCSQHDDDEQYSQFVLFIEQKENNTPEFLCSKKEHWHVEGDGTFSMTLQFTNPEKCYEASTSVMLLFFIDSSNTEALQLKFSGSQLQPNTQTVCVSHATRFLVLTGVQAQIFTQENVKLRMELQHDSAKKIGLAELQAVMYRTKIRTKQASPGILLFSKKLMHENASHTNGTFLFLCELQKFLNEVFPQGNALHTQREISTLGSAALRSLPPLPLGASSSESLLFELVNSNSPTVFYFPRQASDLMSHRVELELNPPLLSVLKFKLSQALAQVRTEQIGRDAMDTLRILSLLSALPGDGEAPQSGLENKRDVQYRAVLLLKALQAVLGTWAVERAQRAARAGQKGPRLRQCHLESLTVSLEKYLLEPSVANIKNCEGECGFPLINGNNHAIMLNSHVQSGQLLNRTLCCVPVAYDDLCVIEMYNDNTVISYKTNMVAKECGCR